MKKIKCTVRDGRFVEPCDTLSKAVDGHVFSKARGLYVHDSVDVKSGDPSRATIGIRTRAFKNGLLLNFCPWCGAQIDEPFT